MNLHLTTRELLDENIPEPVSSLMDESSASTHQSINRWLNPQTESALDDEKTSTEAKVDGAAVAAAHKRVWQAFCS
jgi:hypothetical protein